MTEHITVGRALELLERVVEKHGPDTTRSCAYVVRRDDELVPWCIAGCVFAEVGVPLDDLYGQTKTVFTLWESDELDDVVDLAPHAALILNIAQRIQDENSSWGEALDAARQKARELGYAFAPLPT
jgi:hypothetical protein